MSDQFTSRLSDHDHESITVRDRTLSTEIMGEMSFGAAVYLLLTGEEPTDGECRLVETMLSSLMVHGTTPHAIATRMTLLSEPESTQGAIASGLLGVGSRFAGAMEESARDLRAVADADDREGAVEDLVADYRERGDNFSGIGHPHFDPVDPRAQRLFDLSAEAGVAGVHTEALHDVQERFEAETGLDLPINVTGAIAATTSDMGLPPEAARGFAVVGRAAGLLAEVIEEKESPVAMDLWQLVDERMEYEGDGA